MNFPDLKNVLTIYMKDGSKITSNTTIAVPFDIEQAFYDNPSFGKCSSDVTWRGDTFEKGSLMISVDQISAIHTK